MTDSNATPTALLISRDFLFSSKVTGTAAALGLQAVVVADVADLAAKLAATPCRCVIVDLSLPGLKVVDVVSALPAENRPAVIAFGAHVDTARLQEAHKAGCDEVMPRSKLSATLPEILTRYLQG